MQLSLFDNIETTKQFIVTECDENYETLFNEHDTVKNWGWKDFTKSELLNIIANADKTVKWAHSWSVYYQEDNKYWEILTRGGKPMNGGSTGGFKDIKRYIDAKWR